MFFSRKIQLVDHAEHIFSILVFLQAPENRTTENLKNFSLFILQHCITKLSWRVRDLRSWYSGKSPFDYLADSPDLVGLPEGDIPLKLTLTKEQQQLIEQHIPSIESNVDGITVVAISSVDDVRVWLRLFRYIWNRLEDLLLEKNESIGKYTLHNPG